MMCGRLRSDDVLRETTLLCGTYLVTRRIFDKAFHIYNDCDDYDVTKNFHFITGHHPDHHQYCRENERIQFSSTPPSPHTHTLPKLKTSCHLHPLPNLSV